MTTNHLDKKSLRRELEANRRSERWLVLKALIAMAFVALLVVIRQIFFP